MTGNQTGAVPKLVEVRATQVSPPPGWALLERRLMKLMEDAVEPMVDKYAEKGGAFYYADDLDDLYERVYNWGLVLRDGGRSQGARPRVAAMARNHPVLRRRHRQPRPPPLSTPDPQRVLQPSRRRCQRVVPPRRGQHGLLPFRLGRSHHFGKRAPRQTVRGDVHGRGSRGPQLRPPAQDLPQPHSDQRRPHAPRHGGQRDHVAAGRGNGLREEISPLQGADHPRSGGDRPRGELVRESRAPGGDPQAVRPHRPQRRRPPQPRCHWPHHQRLPLHRRGQVQAVGARLHRGMDGAHRAQRRHSARQRPGRPARSAKTATACGGAGSTAGTPSSATTSCSAPSLSPPSAPSCSLATSAISNCCARRSSFS